MRAAGRFSPTPASIFWACASKAESAKRVQDAIGSLIGKRTMMNKIIAAIFLMAVFLPVSLQAQYTKPVYISLPGPGNIQHLAYVVGKEKKFYDEMGIANAQIVVLRGNAINVQALFFLGVWSGHADDVSR
jgi:hypothetical protein